MYLLDANVFIQAKNLYYGFDICPAFWEWLDIKNSDGRVFSVDKVRDELIGTADELAEWATGHHQKFFLKAEADTFQSLRMTSQWAQSSVHEPAAVSTFLQAADYYLVAQGHAYGHTVVTHEKYDPNTKKRIKIPNACSAVGVNCITPYEMLRRERARFVLGKAA